MKPKKYLRRGAGLITTGIVIGSIPNISGTASESTIKSNTMTGLANVSSTFPAMGSMIGTGMVLKQVRKLQRRSRR